MLQAGLHDVADYADHDNQHEHAHRGGVVPRRYGLRGVITALEQVENQQHKFLHRLHMMHFDPISLPELLDRINASKYREKTKKKLRRIAKKANGCVSLAAVQKDCRIRKSEFIKLLGKFEEMGVGYISFKS